MNGDGKTKPPRSIGARVSVGAALLVSANLGVRLIGIVSLAILGRLLTPEDFGVAALALLATGFVEAAVNDQFAQALIRRRDAGPEHFDTAFTLAALFGVVAGAGVALSAAPLAALLDAPALEEVLPWLALHPILMGLRNPYFTIHLKRLRYGPSLVAAVGPRLASSGVAIALAALWGDYWAMVAAALAFAAGSVVVTFAMAPRRLRFRAPCWREFAAFGGWLTAAGVTRFSARRADTAILGGMLSVPVVGVYNLGAELATTATQQLTSAIVNAAFPGLAAISADRGRLWSGYLKVLEVSVGVLTPIAFGVGLVATEAIILLVGPSWLLAAPVVAWLAPATALGAVSTAAQTVVTVEGRTRSLFVRSAIVLAAQIPLLVIAITEFGLMGAVYVRVFSAALTAWLTVLMVSRLANGRMGDSLLRLWRTAAATAAMVAAVTALEQLGLPPATDIRSALTGLAAKAAVGAAAYVAAHGALWRLVGKPEGLETHLISVSRGILNAATRSRT